MGESLKGRQVVLLDGSEGVVAQHDPEVGMTLVDGDGAQAACVNRGQFVSLAAREGNRDPEALYRAVLEKMEGMVRAGRMAEFRVYLGTGEIEDTVSGPLDVGDTCAWEGE